MKITDNRQKTKMKKYHDMQSGDTFLHDGELHMVTDLRVSSGGERYSYRLCDGKSFDFAGQYEVVEVTAEVIIKE